MCQEAPCMFSFNQIHNQLISLVSSCSLVEGLKPTCIHDYSQYLFVVLYSENEYRK